MESAKEIKSLLKEKRNEIMHVASRYGAINIRVFGSVARGDSDEKSDIDFLVEMKPGHGLFDMGGMLMDLQTLLGRTVDVITPQGIKPRIRNRILREAIEL
jgi:uncharacterized protein